MNFRCANCVFFYQYRPPSFVGEMTRGQCRRYAPSLYQEEGGMLRSAWPMVHVDAFCGEHAMIDEAGAEADRQTEEAERRPAEPPEVRPPPFNNGEPQVIGPQWRCINCKEITTSGTEPDKCVFCQCRQFASVSI